MQKNSKCDCLTTGLIFTDLVTYIKNNNKTFLVNSSLRLVQFLPSLHRLKSFVVGFNTSSIVIKIVNAGFLRPYPITSSLLP